MAEEKKTKEPQFTEYKGKPLVRCGKNIYYGDMNDPYVVYLTVKTEKEENGVMVADDVTVQLMRTDPNVSPKDMVVNKSEKKGVFTALDLGAAWLERHLRKAE